jgi:hypothetical protein
MTCGGFDRRTRRTHDRLAGHSSATDHVKEGAHPQCGSVPRRKPSPIRAVEVLLILPLSEGRA